MEAAYISALAALAGTAIGGLTSFATSWTTQQAQVRAQRLANERDKREALFGRFLEEAARLYADALVGTIVDTYLAPNTTLAEMRSNWVDKHVDPLRDFSEACREEIRNFGRT